MQKVSSYWLMSLMGLFILCFIACTAGSGRLVDHVPQKASGLKRTLLLAVSFPDVTNTALLPVIKKRILDNAANYYREVSYGKTIITGEIMGWYTLPQPLSSYNLSPYIFDSDNKTRVRRLVQDALNAADQDANYDNYDLIIIVVGVQTWFRKGYGQHALCANPGYMSLGSGARMEKVVTRSGQSFNRGIVVYAPNTHPGNVVHDLAHAMGGVVGGRRVIPDYYSHKLFDKTIAEVERGRAPLPSLESYDDLASRFTVYMGPWDVMSLWFLKYNLPPQGMSSFTRLKLGWIEDDQVEVISPVEKRVISISPLSSGKGTLAVKIPAGKNKYFLLENRLREGMDRLMPASGLLILRVDETIRDEEGVVRIVDACPDIPDFKAAAFGVDNDQKKSADLGKDGAVEVLWQEGSDLTVLAAAGPKSSEIREIAKRVREIYGKSGLSEASGALLKMLGTKQE